MTLTDAIASVKSILDEYRAKPQQFLSGHVVMVLKPKGRRTYGGERVRVLPGVLGRLLCVNPGDEAVVDVEVAALERWLAKAQSADAALLAASPATTGTTP